jgi:hypothetical protein
MELEVSGHLFMQLEYTSKEFELTLVDGPDIQKIKKMLQHLSPDRQKAVPIKFTESGIKGHLPHLVIRLCTQKLVNQMGENMRKAGKTAWLNQKFRVRFQVRKYKFTSQMEHNRGETVEGFNFYLKNIELEN